MTKQYNYIKEIEDKLLRNLKKTTFVDTISQYKCIKNSLSTGRYY